MIDAAIDSVIARISAEVAARIAADPPTLALGDVFVGPYPDSVATAHQQVARHAAILVAHDGTAYAAAESMHPISQAGTVDIAVTFYVRSLRGPRGANGLLELVRLALLGWAPTGARPLTLSTERFTQVVGAALWQFTAIYQTRSHVVARLPAAPTEPVLVSTSITGTAVVVPPTLT